MTRRPDSSGAGSTPRALSAVRAGEEVVAVSESPGVAPSSTVDDNLDANHQGFVLFDRG